jgi:hypothetical protein
MMVASHGGCSSAGRAPPCGGGCRGFKSRHSPACFVGLCPPRGALAHERFASSLAQVMQITRQATAALRGGPHGPLVSAQARAPRSTTCGANCAASSTAPTGANRPGARKHEVFPTRAEGPGLHRAGQEVRPRQSRGPSPAAALRGTRGDRASRTAAAEHHRARPGRRLDRPDPWGGHLGPGWGAST